MSSSKAPPPQAPTPPPVTSTGADAAQAELDQKKREADRYGLEQSIAGTRRTPSATTLQNTGGNPGLKTTLT